MSGEASQLEAAILRIERLVQLVDLQVVYLEERVRKQEEWLAQSWVAPSWNATVVGYVDGCNSLGLAGAKVTFKDHASGAVLTTTTTDVNGKYVAAMRLTTSPQSVDIVATPPAAYATEFAASGMLNVSLSYGANTVGTAVVIGPATGYVCDVGVVPVLVCTSGRLCVTAKDSCNNPAVGATITVQDTQTPPNTIGTCTTDATGACCISIPKQTAYTVSCALSGTTTQTQTVNGVCAADTAVGFTLSNIGQIAFTLADCDGYKSGGTLAVTGPASFTLTSGATSTPVVQSCPTGSYTGTVTYPGSSLTESVSITVTNCNSAAVNAVYVQRVSVCSFFTGFSCCTNAYSATITDATSGATIGTGSGTVVTGPPYGCGYPTYNCYGQIDFTLTSGAIPNTAQININYTFTSRSVTQGPYFIQCDFTDQVGGTSC